MFRKKATLLILISALLLPFIFLIPDSMTAALIAALFIALQAIIVLEFAKADELGWEHWCAFWAALIGLGFSLLLVITGRTFFSEFIALLIFMIYFIMIILLLFIKRMAKAAKRIARPMRKKQKRASGEERAYDEELESFRRKDQLKELAEFFEPEQKPDVDYFEIKEPKIEKIVAERLDDEAEREGWEEWNGPGKQEELEIDDNTWKRVEEVLDAEEWKEIEQELPKSVIYDYSQADEKENPLAEFGEKPKIIELKEAPKVDFTKVKSDLDRIDQGVKTLNEKIKEISERAIKEGEEKKKIAKALKRLPRPKKKEMRVYASKNSTKFHYKRSCLGLRRVKSKDMLTFANSEEARKKRLKACGICKK
ncbi:hypothetical protein JXB28_06170 [Candidatus Woesearchaeota archaeon]|nr:hypothetical protein [Candidatus Woesearchaeota archaeon]